jgi:hypothetical protein
MKEPFPWSIQPYMPQVAPKTLGEYIGKYNEPGQAVKFDDGKTRFNLIPFDLLGPVEEAWEFGAKKYSANNWRKGMPWTQPLNAALRHITDYMAGEDLDSESKQTHIAHAMCCLFMALNNEKHHRDRDDRNKWKVY